MLLYRSLYFSCFSNCLKKNCDCEGDFQTAKTYAAQQLTVTDMYQRCRQCSNDIRSAPKFVDDTQKLSATIQGCRHCITIAYYASPFDNDTRTHATLRQSCRLFLCLPTMHHSCRLFLWFPAMLICCRCCPNVVDIVPRLSTFLRHSKCLSNE